MTTRLGAWLTLVVVVVGGTGLGVWHALHPNRGQSPGGAEAAPEPDSATPLRPFLERYCLSCHGSQKREAELDLSTELNEESLSSNSRRWEQVLQRLQAEEMPPEDAPLHPRPEERAAVIAWLTQLREREAARNAGDPGVVLAHRLSNAEFDHTIRDLTGIDIRPTREFPVDPANEAGFDNTGESLAMSPALSKKYLTAARLVADHAVLKPGGIVFAPHPAVTDTDRDRYCVRRILDFYDRHQVDLADYLLAAWKYHHRKLLGRPDAPRSAFASEAGLSHRYLSLVGSALEAREDQGPMAIVQKKWRDLPTPGAASTQAVRSGCEQMRDLVARLRRQLEPRVGKVQVKGISAGSQPLVLWRNRQLASRHRSYSGDVFPDLRKLAEQIPGPDRDMERLLLPKEANAEVERQMREALEQFCSVFPGAFVVSDRGPYFNPKDAGKGRPLTAGFHLMQGYFRDDAPLCELILDDEARAELDGLWHELDFVARASERQYKDFIFFERAEPPRFMIDAQFDFARSEDRDATSEAKMARLARAYLARAKKQGAKAEALEAIESYFSTMSKEIREVESARRAAEPGHLEALTEFAMRAYRRPLSPTERDDLLAFYRTLRQRDGLGHEEAVRDTLVSILMSPHFCYRLVVAEPGSAPGPLSGYELASRLSYFLWASMPDSELLAHAAAGDLHRAEVLLAQARRMLRDGRVRGLATEFGGNWLDFRRFEEHNSVDRERFPTFTNEMRQAMFEEPIRYLVDVAQRNRSVLDFLHGKDTFVNAPLARHYGIPEPKKWVRVEDATPQGRGGLLPMAVFLTRNAPGLRTSPVKRGYWVVRRLLGEQIPPPPPAVPELPRDEASTGELTLPQLLARHREDKSCAGCHRRFDSLGLAFEGYGPVGERRTLDLGGRPVQTTGNFPDGRDREGLGGLRAYLRDRRQNEFLDNLCRKLYSFALGRGLQLSDDRALEAMRARLVTEGYVFGSLVEAIVTTPQFLNKRGRDDASSQ